jgi:hypothetical protein
MIAAFQSFIGDPVRYRRLDLAWFRLTQLLHERTNGAFDAAYMRLARVLRPKVALPDLAQMPAGELAAAVARLRQDGYMMLPFGLSAEQIDALKAFAFSTPAHAADMQKNYSVSADKIPPGHPRFNWWMQEVVRLPVVQRLITEGPYCAIAQEYLGCRPVLSHVTLFLDAPLAGHYGAYDYHCDNEGPHFLKFFFFLTDVSLDTGAHHFIAGSHAHRKPKRFARSTFYTSEDLFSVYDRSREVVVAAPAGSILAEDTAGFHRGSEVERGYRLVMQFEFSAIDCPTEFELARELVPIAVPDMHPGIASIARKFYRSPAK